MDDANAIAQETSNLSINGTHNSSPPIDQPTYQPNAPYKPQASRMRGPTVHDITEDFTNAASALKIGELVKDEYFTLFESVGALEIMDPKMDSGYLAEGETLDDDYDVLRDLLPEEVVGIMDQMLCYEMAWHMGYPLSQSLFTSLYIDRLLWPEPPTLEEACFDRDRSVKEDQGLLHLILRAYCLGLIKACDFVYQRVSAEHYYEEEDFVLSLYNRSLLAKFDSSDIVTLLEKALDMIGNGAFDLSENLKQALSTRIKLRIHLLAAVDVNYSGDKAAAGEWEACIGLLSHLKDTNKHGKPVERSFSAKMQRKLASTVPPRPIAIVSFDGAWDLLSRICWGGRDAYSILDYHGGTWLQNFIWSFQSRMPQPPTYIRCLLQSLVFSEMKVLGSRSVKQLLFDDLEETCLPTDVIVDDGNSAIEAPQDSRFQISKRMDGFVRRAADAYIDVFRTLCMNRSRLRRMLCHLILDWDSLQLDAENFDIELRQYTNEEPIRDEGEVMWSFPLSSWAYYHKLEQLEWIVQMGFELDVYQIDELGGMYWHLQHLAQTRIQHLERISAFTMQRMSQIPSPSEKEAAAFGLSISFLDFTMLQASATKSFANGLSSLYSLYAQLGLLKGPYSASPYGSPELRYTLRMRPFLAISLPEVPTYDQFLASVSLRPDPRASPAKKAAQATSILNVAERAFKSARKDWEAVSKASAEVARCQGCEEWWRAGVKDVLRSVIMAGIAVASVKKTLNSVGNVDEVKDNFKISVGGGGEAAAAAAAAAVNGKGKGRGYHAWWIVPEMTAA